MTNPISLPSTFLWDIAGVDGLAVMKRLIGEECDRIAPFQSLETDLDHTPCTILRLCEANFRLRWMGDSAHLQSRLGVATADQQVWVKQFPWLVSVPLLHGISVEQLSGVAIARVPFSVEYLGMDCAAPVRIGRHGCLIWRHSIQGRAVIELHSALQTIQELKGTVPEIF